MTYSTFVINLARDTERRAYMQKQLATLGISAEFVPAVDGRALSAEDRSAYDRKKALRVYGVEMMDTEIGCYLSHYRLWQRMLREDIATALIMEDDIVISPDLPNILRDLVAGPSPQWLVVRLESMRGKVREARTEKFKGRSVQQLSGGELYRLDTHILGFGAYLIRKEGAERMLDYGRRIFMPVDQTMDRFWENGIVPYLVRPIPVHQRQDFASRIGARPAGRHQGQAWGQYVARRWQRVVDGVRKRVFVALSRPCGRGRGPTKWGG